MALRKVALTQDEVYHVFNRSLEKKRIFSEKIFCDRFLTAASYYRYLKPPVQLASFCRWSKKRKKDFFKQSQESPRLVEVIAYCVMPTHFHFMLRNLVEDGISRYLSLIQNSFVRYYNTLNKRLGTLFQGAFKAVRVEDDNQLVHLSRYIHLNPYSASLVDSLESLVDYESCSLGEYLGKRKGFSFPKPVLDLFSDSNEYWSFISNQADYQRSLQKIKERFAS